MKRFLLTFTLFTAPLAATAQNDSDSLRLIRLQEVEVTATRATPRTPVAYTDLSRARIQSSNFGLDIPSLLAVTPSMVATNETGIGIGGTSIRLRGADATRLNVTVNGVSINNPDSHSVYWYDTPDLLSSVGSMQVQRGAGVSTNGTGAFGGSVSMTTDALSTVFNGEASLSYGSYNTNKQAVHVGSGLLGGHWIVDARLSHIGSDGYIDRGATDLKSYMLQGAYYNGQTMLKLLSYGGKAKTYLTYTGVTLADMALYGRRYHTEGQYYTSKGPHVLSDGSHVDYYDDHTDNYLQINNQLVLTHRFNDRWALNATGFYTYGYGYYNQYKSGRKLCEYLFPDEIAFDAAGDKVKKDMIRQKMMRNHLGGLHAAAAYTGERINLNFGGAYSYYTCPHWGEFRWIEDLDAKLYKDRRWYDNDVNKQDANLFARADWTVVSGLQLYADLQYRFVRYQAWGVNDNYHSAEVGMQPIDVDKSYNFLNPHVGLNYTIGKRHNLYFSFAVSHKEPTRSDFTDRYMFSPDDSQPKHETLLDYELGYNYRSEQLQLGVNLYYMGYRDQLVPTGMVNDGSDALNTNVPDSYRMGVELTGAWHATRWLTASGNAAFSSNKIRDYVDLLADSPTYGQNLGTMTIAYSPEVVANVALDFHHKGFEAILTTRYVGEQYFTNNELKVHSLGSYCITDLNLGYTLTTRTTRSVRFGVQIYNLFNREYCSNGYGYSYMDTWSGDTPKRIDETFYFPQAPLHVLANVTVKF